MNNIKNKKPQKRTKANSTFKVKNSNVRLNGTVPNVPVVQPFQETRQLTYVELSSPYDNTVNPMVVTSIEMTNAYDENSAIFSNSTQYLLYQGTLYSRAKVVGVDAKVTLSNLEQHSLDAGLFVSPNSLVTSFGSRGACTAMFAGGTCVAKKVMTEQYGDQSHVVLRYRCHPGDVLGSRIAYDAGDEYAFDPSSSGPVVPIYLLIAVVSPFSTMPNGFTQNISISLVIRFYELKPLSTFILKEAPRGFKPFITIIHGEEKREHPDTRLQTVGRLPGPSGSTAHPLLDQFDNLPPQEQKQILDILRHKVTRSKTN